MKKIILDLASPKEMSLEEAITYVQEYKRITKYNYERLYRTFKYQIKGIETKELLRLAGIKG